MTAREYERASKVLEGLLETYPDDPIRFQVYLLLGKYHLEQRRFQDAVGYLTRVHTLEKPD